MTNMMNNLRSVIHSRLQNDRGAVLVEAAICIPLLLLIILGAVEAGLAWEAKSSSVSGVRSGVLRAATGGGDADTDLRILQAVVGEVGADNTDRIEWVMVFDASGDPAQNFQACAAGATTGCVVYDRAFLADVATTTADPTAFQNTHFNTSVVDGNNPGSFTCDTGRKDSSWCAAQRTATGDAEVGVAIRYNHEWISGIFPFEAPDFTEFVVTSTFAEGGTDISGALPFAVTPTTLPTQPGTFFDFSTPGNATSDPDISIDPNNEHANLVQTAPGGESFLGPLPSGEITIQIRNRVPGETVCIDFDLYALGSWDANGRSADRFEARIQADDGSVLAATGRSHYDSRNGDPAQRDQDTIGLDYGHRWNGTVSHPVNGVCAVVPANGTINVVFEGDLTQRNRTNTDITDEGFGIDNIRVY